MTDIASTSGSARVAIRRALVSVYDKTGLVELATALVEAGVEIVSTGSTAKTIAAAGLDVFEGEPSVHPALLTVPNVVLTPHIASASIPTRRAMADLAADNLISFLEGRGALTPVQPNPSPADTGAAR